MRRPRNGSSTSSERGARGAGRRQKESAIDPQGLGLGEREVVSAHPEGPAYGPAPYASPEHERFENGGGRAAVAEHEQPNEGGTPMMDKVQVDTKKLQLLNDRINQTIDAINQLRQTALSPWGGAVSGFGVQHSTLPAAAYPFGAIAGAFGSPTAVWGAPYGQLPAMGAAGVAPFASSAMGVPYGFQHSTFADPMSIARRELELAALVQSRALAALAPYGTAPYAAAALGGGIAAVPYAGLYHSPWAARTGAEVILGAFDPVVRQMELARANEANRAWELAQGMGVSHTPATTGPFAMLGALPFAPIAAPFSAFGAALPAIGAFGAYGF